MIPRPEGAGTLQSTSNLTLLGHDFQARVTSGSNEAATAPSVSIPVPSTIGILGVWDSTTPIPDASPSPLNPHGFLRAPPPSSGSPLPHGVGSKKTSKKGINRTCSHRDHGTTERCQHQWIAWGGVGALWGCGKQGCTSLESAGTKVLRQE